MSVLVLVPHCFYYYSSVLVLKSGNDVSVPTWLFCFKTILAINIYFFSFWPHLQHVEGPGPEIEPVSQQQPSRCSDNARSLTCCATRELQKHGFFLLCVMSNIYKSRENHRMNSNVLITWFQLLFIANFVSSIPQPILQHTCICPWIIQMQI